MCRHAEIGDPVTDPIPEKKWLPLWRAGFASQVVK